MPGVRVSPEDRLRSFGTAPPAHGVIEQSGRGSGQYAARSICRGFGTRSIVAIAEFLGTKPFFMGSEPTGVDATIFAFVAGTLCPHFDTPLRTAAECHNNLRRYIGRMTARYYPDLGEIAGCKAAA